MTGLSPSGTRRFRGVLEASQCDRIAALFTFEGRPGGRLDRSSIGQIGDLICDEGPVGAIAIEMLGSGAQPVRALLLDKSPEANWALGWHQDRTIAVEERIEVDGFGPWSVKAGQLHVQPPHAITERMVTLRAHVDSVDAENAPLEVVAGSHLLGRLTNKVVDRLAAKGPIIACLADAGDVWAYGTAIVHRSAEQRRPGRRRVLQVDYSADELPGQLRWSALADGG